MLKTLQRPSLMLSREPNDLRISCGLVRGQDPATLQPSVARASLHVDKPRRRKSADRGRMNMLWCASGQRSPTASEYDAMPYDIPHMVRRTKLPTSASSPATINLLKLKTAAESDHSSVDSGVDVRSNVASEREKNQSNKIHQLVMTNSNQNESHPILTDNLPLRNSQKYGEDASPTRISQDFSSQVINPKPAIWRSISSFSLRTFTLRRKESSKSRQVHSKLEVENNRMEQSRKRVGGSMPGDDRLSFVTPIGMEDEVLRKRTHTIHVGERLSRLGRSFRRRRLAERVGSGSNQKNDGLDPISAHHTIVLYGTACRRRSSFKSASLTYSDGNGISPVVERKSDDSECDPMNLDLLEGVQLVKILKLDQYMTNKWISGMTVTEKNELVLVDLREAYLVDDCGNLIRTIGLKGSERLLEPIAVSQGLDGRLVFSDHAEQCVKIFTNRGNHLRTVTDFSQANIAGVACDRATGEIFIAGTDRKKLFAYSGGETRTIPGSDHDARHASGGITSRSAAFKHPFSVAFNSVSREIIVGDDYDQSVIAVSPVDGQQLWRFCPPINDAERQFFPSSVCVDQDGMIFVADLYNGKVFMLDSKGRFMRTILARGKGLKGNPGAITTDNKHHLFVADEERTVKVFRYNCTQCL